jgi:hypothetical protein
MRQLLLLVALLMGGQAYGTQHQFTGLVLDGSGNGLQGITVRIYWPNGSGPILKESVTTDSTGRFVAWENDGSTLIAMVPGQDGWTFTPASLTGTVPFGNPVDIGTFTGSYTPPSHHKKKSGGCALSEVGSPLYWLLQGASWALVGLIGYHQTRKPRG